MQLWVPSLEGAPITRLLKEGGKADRQTDKPSSSVWAFLGEKIFYFGKGLP